VTGERTADGAVCADAFVADAFEDNPAPNTPHATTTIGTSIVRLGTTLADAGMFLPVRAAWQGKHDTNAGQSTEPRTVSHLAPSYATGQLVQ
jgi:hypothetical protein